MLLVLGDVAGDRLVAELAQLDPDLLGGHRVGAVADHRPVAARTGRSRRAASAISRLQGRAPCASRRAAPAARPAARGARWSRAAADRLGDGAGQQRARRHLGVERLGRGHAHLDVAAVGRVEHAVGLVGEVAAAAVDDADHGRAAGPGQVDRAVRVGRGAALADGDDQRVGHVEGRRWKPDSSVAVIGIDVDAVAAQPRRAARPWPATATAAVPWPMHEDAADGPVGEAIADGRGQRPVADRGAEQPLPLDDVAPQRLGEALRRLADLLQQEVGGVAAVDVAGRDLGRHQLVLVDGQRRAVVGEPHDAVELARSVGRRAATTCPPLSGWSAWAGVSPSMRR